jgi:hypothetical protein
MRWGYFTTESLSVCLGIERPWGTCDQILLPVGMLLSQIFGLVYLGSPLWREDWSRICSAITQWSESRRTRNHTLLSHLRLPQPGGPGSRIYIPQEQGSPVIPTGTGLCRSTFGGEGGGYFTLLWQRWVPETLKKMFLGSKVRPVRGADNLTAICEPIV